MKLKGNNEINPSSLPVAGGVKRIQALFNLQRHVVTKKQFSWKLSIYWRSLFHLSLCNPLFQSTAH